MPAVMRLDGVEVEGAAQITDKHCQLDSEELWRRALRSPVMPGCTGYDTAPSHAMRRRVAMLVCLYKLVGGVLDDSALLSKLQFSVPRLNSRSRLLFSPRYSRTNLAATLH
ncbi:hypothetical protein J6590_083392 [Homalodisca vitripennis]|nr:hypothetical protein J6590_083392 [Homalodisca vitripennis]